MTRSWYRFLPFIMMLASLPAAANSPSPGYFRVGTDTAGTWWFIDPQGKPFYSRGVDQVSAEGDLEFLTHRRPYRDTVLKKYGPSPEAEPDAAKRWEQAQKAWAAATADRLGSWGFNTIGSWSQDWLFRDRMAVTPIVGCKANYHPRDKTLADGSVAKGFAIGDFWDEDYAVAADQAAVAATRDRREDRNVIGYFLDNEMNFGADYRSLKHAFRYYFALPPLAPGKQAIGRMLTARYGTIEVLNAKWRTKHASFAAVLAETSIPGRVWKRGEFQDFLAEFLYRMGQQYFGVCSRAIRAHDPNHLLLGNRLISNFTHPGILKAAAETQDVISINYYRYTLASRAVIAKIRYKPVVPSDDWLRQFNELTGRPLLISEFSSRAITWRKVKYPPFFLPRNLSLFPPLIFYVEFSQKARTKRAEDYVVKSQAASYVVGHHFYEWADEPFWGRVGDLEDSNWGLVNSDDEAYSRLTEMFAAHHREGISAAEGVTFPAGGGAVGAALALRKGTFLGRAGCATIGFRSGLGCCFRFSCGADSVTGTGSGIRLWPALASFGVIGSVPALELASRLPARTVPKSDTGLKPKRKRQPKPV